MNGVKPDGFIVSLLPLCGGADIEKWDYGREVHCYIMKYELDLKWGSDVHLGCYLIDMYSRSYRVDLGRRVFDLMKCRNVYAWTAMINGYVQSGAPDEALVHFQKMQVEDETQ
ncbi:pentatricopeptide repeat-containing protein [Prunus yedoensis var. nudiflora]|uniref:Pentatricopeptide repeat-containing protein n=1 Tax=Prunus yedoensis var. nudiflora TaxID=2094558 RepID=A0A314YYC7_PRUYE|nr:pentatricopeptide repeat-containing protein [Prunus yedoensis var. nudiflora]